MIPVLQSKVLGKLSTINHAFTTRQGGVSQGYFDSLNAIYDKGDSDENVTENRRRICESLGTTSHSLITAHQTHSTKALIVNHSKAEAEADALVTNTPGLTIGIKTADCVPILFADSQNKVIAAVHAGWKGAVSGILENTLTSMTQLGAKTDSIVAAIGPCIWQKSYEVGQELYEQVIGQGDSHKKFFIPSPKPQHWQFDLPGYVAGRLKSAGIAVIEDSPADTYADPERFFSFRRKTHLGESNFGCSLSVITLRDSV